MTQKVIKFESLDSTNNYVAKALQSGHYSENDVILAGFQTEGRGQRGNIWQSEFNKNLTFSFAFPIDFLNLDQQFIISKAVSVAIAEYLEEKTGMPIALKWPNDILIENQKICGILLETVLVDRARYMIVGIGLNINQASFNTDYAATSLSLELGRSLDLDEELSLLLPYINSCIDIVKGGRADEIEVSYLARLRGSQGFAKFSDEEASYRGKIVFVDNSGEITVKSEDRKLKNYRSGEVKITY
jgi:BirA family biotin operon repressor/biotin-[acetyl-CoA-carboxylase] ligase